MKAIIKIAAVLLLLVGAVGAYVWFGVFQKNITTKGNEKVYFFIKTNDGFEEVMTALADSGYVNQSQFEWLADLRSYKGANIYPGRYTFSSEMSYTDLLLHLRSGKIDEVTVTFNNVRTLDQLATKIASQIEASEADLSAVLSKPQIFGFTKATFLSSFIPNTYKMYWNTNAEGFVKRMIQEHKRFWNDKRLALAKNINLNPVQCGTLASIVQSEQSLHSSEWPMIAGLYINRLKKGMKLQSDPTVVFAWGNFGLKRIYYKHLKIDSKYNTYKYSGLPPGPIRVPSPKAIDAVLNYKRHNYIFMCAKPEFSGLHNFAVTNAQHERNAAKYRAFLKKNKIK